MPTPLYLFAGGRLEGLSITAGPAISEDNNNGGYDATYSDCAVDLPSSTTVNYLFYDASKNPFTVSSGHYAMQRAYLSSQSGHLWANTSGPFFGFIDSTGVPRVGVQGDGGITGCFITHNTGTLLAPNWVSVSGNSGIVDRAGYYDFQVTVDAGGNHVVNVYAGNSLALSATVSDANITGGLTGSFFSGSGIGLQISQLLATQDLSTVGAFVKTIRGVSAGTYQQWAGGVTGVNAPTTNDATPNQATTAGLKQTYNMGNVTVPAGFNIGTVFYWLRAKNDGVTPTSIEAALISSDTAEYDSGNLGGLGLGFSGVFNRYDTNPATSGQWTQAQWNTPVQLGFISEA